MPIQVVEQDGVASLGVELGAEGGFNAEQSIENPFGAEASQIVIDVVGGGGEGRGEPAIGGFQIGDTLVQVGFDGVGGKLTRSGFADQSIEGAAVAFACTVQL